MATDLDGKIGAGTTMRLSEPAASRSQAEGDGRGHRGGIAIAICLLGGIALAPAIGNGFVDFWDDREILLANPHFHGLGWSQFLWAWRARVAGVYQPLAWMLFSAESAAWGLQP